MVIEYKMSKDQSYFPIRVRYDTDNKDRIVNRPEDLRSEPFVVLETKVKND